MGGVFQMRLICSIRREGVPVETILIAYFKKNLWIQIPVGVAKGRVVVVPLQLSGELGAPVGHLVLLGFQWRTCCIRGLCSQIPCVTCPTPIDCGCGVWLLLLRTERKLFLFIQLPRHLVSAVVAVPTLRFLVQTHHGKEWRIEMQ